MMVYRINITLNSDRYISFEIAASTSVAAVVGALARLKLADDEALHVIHVGRPPRAADLIDHKPLWDQR